LKNKLFGYEGKPFEELFKRLKKKKKKKTFLGNQTQDRELSLV
jgi:hypothetical protein